MRRDFCRPAAGGTMEVGSDQAQRLMEAEGSANARGAHATRLLPSFDTRTKPSMAFVRWGHRILRTAGTAEVLCPPFRRRKGSSQWLSGLGPCGQVSFHDLRQRVPQKVEKS